MFFVQALFIEVKKWLIVDFMRSWIMFSRGHGMKMEIKSMESIPSRGDIFRRLSLIWIFLVRTGWRLLLFSVKSGEGWFKRNR